MLDNNETEVLPEGVAAEASPATQDAAPAQAPQPVQPAVAPFGGQQFDAQNYGMDYRGQRVFPRDAAHLKQLAQQGFSYSQSMEKLGSDTKALEARTQELETTYGKYKDFDEQLKNNPEQYNKFQAYWNGNGEVPEQSQGNGQTFNRVYDEKVQALEGKIQSLLDANEDNALKGNMEKLRSENPNFDWDADNGDGNLSTRVMRHAQQLGLNENQVHLAFQDYHFNELQNQARVNAAGQVSDKVQQQTKAGIQQGANAIAPPQAAAPVDTKNMSHSQLSELAKADLGL